MADSPNLIEEQAKLISRSKTLAEYSPRITEWFGDLNSYVRVMYNDSAALLKVLRGAEKNFTTIEQYLSDIERFPAITGVNFLDFSVLHDEVLDDPDSVKAKLGIKKSEEYMNVLFPFLDEIYTSLFSDVSGNFQTDLKDQIVRNLDIFRLYLSPRFKTNTTFKSYIVYPYFVYVLFTLLNLTFKLLSDLQEESWKKLSEAKRAQLKAERDTLIQARQKFRDEHSNAPIVLSPPNKESAPNQAVNDDPIKKNEQFGPRQSFSEFLDNEPLIRQNIQNYATVAAYFESVPPELLERLRRDVSIENKEYSQDLDIYFEMYRKSAQRQILAQSKKLYVLEDFKKFGNSGDIQQTKTELIIALVELKSVIPTEETYHRLLTTPIAENRSLRDELEQKSQSISDKKSEQFRKALKLYREQAYLTSLQEEYFEKFILNTDGDSSAEDALLSTIAESIGMTSYSPVEDNLDIFPDQKTSSVADATRKIKLAKNNLKRIQKTTKVAQKLLSNAPVIAGVGAVGGGLALIAGIAAKAAPLIIGGATVTGASVGFLIAGPVGAAVGGVAGAIVGWGTNTLIQSSLPIAQINSGARALEVANMIGKEGVSAAAKVAPETILNASKVANGALQSGQAAASHLAGRGLAGAKSLLAGVSNAGIGSGTSALGAGSLIAGPLVTVSVAAIITATTISNSFIIPNDGQDIATSRYVELTKVMEPDVSSYPDNGVLTPSKSIKYTLTLTPKKDDDGQPYQITIVDATDTISLSSKGKPTAPTIPPLDEFKTNATQTYTLSYDPSFADTRVSNVLSIKFTVKNSKGTAMGDPNGETFSTAATVAFGNPPDDLACMVTDGNWTDEEKQKLAQAFAITSSYPVYRNLLCDHGAIHLVRRAVPPNETWYGAYIAQNTVALYDKVFGDANHPYSLLNLRYTLIHETGHAIGANHPDLYSDFIKNAFSEGRLESYNATVHPVEDFPESLAVYVNYKNRPMGGTIKGCLDMPNRYPAHFAWVQTNIFPEDIGKPDGPVDPAFPLCK